MPLLTAPICPLMRVTIAQAQRMLEFVERVNRVGVTASSHTDSTPQSFGFRDAKAPGHITDSLHVGP